MTLLALAGADLGNRFRGEQLRQAEAAQDLRGLRLEEFRGE